MSDVSMRVDHLFPAETAAARTRPADRTTGTGLRSSFASALASAGAATKATRTLAAERTGGAATETPATKAPAGEVTRPVEGKDYEEIIAGPRNGLFVNRSGNARDGEVFVRVEKDGRDVHIYGSGKDRETVVMWHNEDGAAGGPGTVPAGEVSSRVEGKLYDEITAGPRNGMFINRSGNSRDGLAFVLVKHAHREDHIYGSGRHQQIVRVWDEGHGPDAEDATGSAGDAGDDATSSSSGGIHAP